MLSFNSLFNHIFDSVSTFLMNNFNPLMVNGLLFYGKIVVIAQSKIDDIYVKYPIVESYVKKFTYLMQYLHNTVSDVRTEPIEDMWISTSVLISDEDKTVLFEKFNFIDEIIDDIFSVDNVDKTNAQIDVFTNMYYYLYVNMKTTFINSNELIETMLTLKYKNKYVSCMIFKDTYKYDDFPSLNFPLETSKAKFLSILYTHPKMLKSINIELGEEYYTTNNYILSALYIRRYLEYHYANYNYVFDNNYTVKIMDNNLKIVELNSDQYIQLHKNTYEIKDISKKQK